MTATDTEGASVRHTINLTVSATPTQIPPPVLTPFDTGGAIGDQTLTGRAGTYSLASGNSGNDVIVGNSGSDILSGGDGNDLLFGAKGADTLDGGTGSDTLAGGKDADIRTGNTGDDWMAGEIGNDTLTGGAGADKFILKAGTGSDSITDFEHGIDSLVLAGGLTFEKLTITSAGAGTAIGIAGSNEVLAKLNGVDSIAAVILVRTIGAGERGSGGGRNVLT